MGRVALTLAIATPTAAGAAPPNGVPFVKNARMVSPSLNSVEVADLPWIRLLSIGNQDKPFPVIWLSPQPIASKGHFVHEFIALEPEAYARALGTTLRCKQRFGKVKGDASVRLEMTVNRPVADKAGRLVACTLADEALCPYLAALVSDIGKEDVNGSVRNLSRQIGCGRMPGTLNPS